MPEGSLGRSPSGLIYNKHYRDSSEIKAADETFSECSLPSSVSEKTMKKIGHRARKRANLTPFMAVLGLVLITRVVHRSTLHFAVAGSTVILGKKARQV